MGVASVWRCAFECERFEKSDRFGCVEPLGKKNLSFDLRALAYFSLLGKDFGRGYSSYYIE